VALTFEFHSRNLNSTVLPVDCFVVSAAIIYNIGAEAHLPHELHQRDRREDDPTRGGYLNGNTVVLREK
jgi:hypothetical protein